MALSEKNSGSYVKLDNWKFSVRWPNGKAADCYSAGRNSLGGSNPPLIAILNQDNGDNVVLGLPIGSYVSTHSLDRYNIQKVFQACCLFESEHENEHQER